MKIGVKRNDLEVMISSVLYSVAKDYRLTEQLLENMIERGYLVGSIQSIVTGNTPLSTLDAMDLYTLSYELYEVTGDGKLLPETWFTDVEIDNIKIHKRKIETGADIEFPIVLENVLEVEEGAQWITVANMSYISKLWRANMISYNFETQRDPKLVYEGDTIIKIPNTNEKAVNAITDKLIKGKYVPNTITLNVLKNGSEHIIYDRRRMTLTIYEGILNILDGFHRSLGILTALSEGANDRNFELRIANFDVYRAAEFVKQEDIRNKISDDHLASIDMGELANVVVRGLNERVDSDMRGKIATNKDMVKNNRALTMFTTMSLTVRKLWDLKTRRDATVLTDYLVNFFNELIGTHQDVFIDNINSFKQTSYINHETTFIFYLVLAKELEKIANYRELLYNIMEDTDFSKKNSFWSEIGVNTSSPERIKSYSNNIIKESKKIIKKGVVKFDQ